MSNSPKTKSKRPSRPPAPLIEAVWLTRSTLSFDLEDGRSITVPLSFYPPLLVADETLLNQYEIHGASVYWSALRLKLTASDLLAGRRKG